jgi:hypothetical protein
MGEFDCQKCGSSGDLVAHYCGPVPLPENRVDWGEANDLFPGPHRLNRWERPVPDGDPAEYATLAEIFESWGMSAWSMVNVEERPDDLIETWMVRGPDGLWRVCYVSNTGVALDEGHLWEARTGDEAFVKYKSNELLREASRWFLGLVNALAAAQDDPALHFYMLESLSLSTVRGALSAYKRHMPTLFRTYADPQEQGQPQEIVSSKTSTPTD